MTEHYFTSNPQSKHDIAEITANFFGQEFVFKTDAGVFSKNGVDAGTMILISALEVKPGDRVLDLGCGYGPLGIAAAYLAGPTGQVDMIDINERAVDLAKQNAALNNIDHVRVWQSDGFAAVTDVYDWIITNPPIRAGKKVIYPMVEHAYKHLKPGGGLMLVIRTKQGAKSMEKKMQEVFGNAAAVSLKVGYRVLKSIKN